MHGGELIKAVRVARGFTQFDIAEMFGVSLRTYQRWERKHHEPKYSEVIGIVTDICGLTLKQAEELVDIANN